ncbi:MAG: hypothetical protein MI741_02385, partial [Rhodospirillales bacterium]|nr:hypothetical protein [Rhodospirillales bacterium]
MMNVGMPLALGALLFAHVAATPNGALGQSLETPPAEAIDVELLQPAMKTAVRNGIASILARTELNEGLVIPFADSSERGSVVRTEKVTQRYRWAMKDEPLREKIGER